jgi:ubiquinone biosynthesis monooxygenase Coq7
LQKKQLFLALLCMSNSFRTPTLTDTLIGELDRALNNMFCPQKSSRPYPPSLQTSISASEAQEPRLSTEQKHLAAGLMRINHAGEMAAQALYQGQSLTARDPLLAENLGATGLPQSVKKLMTSIAERI